MSEIQKTYRREMAAPGGPGRVLRAVSLFESGRAMMEARALRQQPGLEGEALKVATARLMYRKDPKIQETLAAYESAHWV